MQEPAVFQERQVASARRVQLRGQKSSGLLPWSLTSNDLIRALCCGSLADILTTLQRTVGRLLNWECADGSVGIGGKVAHSGNLQSLSHWQNWSFQITRENGPSVPRVPPC